MPPQFPRNRQTCLIFFVTISLVLAGCSVFSVHRIDVRQGNALKQRDVEQLEIGMNPEQVTYLLGNPLIDDSYHTDRWDYVYYYDPGYGQTEQRRLTVFFESGQVIRIKRPQATAES
ncbi:MAG: outer membrane protein assembly factor BamE [Gammaproteobacteria bacterium]|nr:outer membrane protein assembly factor BamE [Gammaproteobacteria bacterium]